MRGRYGWTFVLWILMVTGAALFVGSGLLYWQGLSAVEDRSGLGREGSQFIEEMPSGVDLTETEAAAAKLTGKLGEEIGEVYFPVLEVSVPIFHGVSEEELVKGVGHVPGSGLPGVGGNIVLSGHRDTVFRRLGELEVGDKVMLGFGGGEYSYKISRIRIVDKEDTSVVVPRPREMLTITTCYPFRFIGNAPERYVVEAELIEEGSDPSLVH